MGNSQSSVTKRVPSLFFACVTQGIVASLQTISRFPAERAIILRERAAGSYHVSAYFAARSVVDFASTAWGTTLFCAIVYPTIGYQPGAAKFFMYWLFMMLDTQAALALETMVSCLCVTLELSTVVLSLLLEITRLYGGFFTRYARHIKLTRRFVCVVCCPLTVSLNSHVTPLMISFPYTSPNFSLLSLRSLIRSPKQLLSYPSWTFADALSYLKYTFVGVAINELSGLEYTCTAKQIAANTCVRTGEETMADKGYDQYTMGFCAGILVVYIFGCRLVAFLALRFFKK